jgi:hypothetical protein
MVVINGCPGKLQTLDPVHFLGTVISELGMISAEQLQASVSQLGQGKLQGQILLEMGAIDPGGLDAALRSQVERKVEHLFTLSNETIFAYYDGVDLLQNYGGPPTPIDPFPVLWRGVREMPQWEHVDATLRRIGTALVRASATAQLDRFAFQPEEMEAVEMLRHRPARMVDMTNTALGPSVGQVLVYFLMIMKQVDLVDPQQQQPGGPMRPAHPPTPPPSSGQAFARVQLQRQPPPGSVPQRPMVVEEVVPHPANDERVSSPGMQAPQVQGAFGMAPSSGGGGAFGRPPVSQPITAQPMQPMQPPIAPPIQAPVAPPVISTAAEPSPAPPPVIQAPAAARGPGGLMDIGSMITQTIQSSMPPAMSVGGPAPAVPAPGSVPTIEAAPSSGQIPAAPASQPGQRTALTAEQSTLKNKILERAEQITSQDYFQMLGLDRDATGDQVQKAFFGLAKVWHPDRLPPALIDVKDACSKVFTHLTEAHATLTDPSRRQDYMTLLKDGGATPEDQAKIQAILEAATEFQKAEFLLKRNMGDPQAYDIVKRCVSLDPEQADYMATLAYLDAQKPEWQSREKTLEKTFLLDRCIQRNQNCERAYFYRGLLFKRIDESNKALKDFKKAAELNPRNLDAMREVRLHNMRGGTSKAPPGMSSGGAQGRASKPPAPETLGGIFGKLFKK